MVNINEEYDEEEYVDSISEVTSDEIIAALEEIAQQDGTTLKQIWEDGYTPKHTYEEVNKMVIKHIKENVKPEELEEYYNWGIEKVWMEDE